MNRYNKQPLDSQRYFTPAHFTLNELNNKVVHAPSDHGLHIVSAVDTTLSAQSNTFIDIEDNDVYTSYLDFEDNDLNED